MSIGILSPTGGNTYTNISGGSSWAKDGQSMAYHADSDHSGNKYYFTWDGTGRYQVKYQQRKRYAWTASDEDKWTAWSAETLLYSGTGYTSAAIIQQNTEVYTTALNDLADAPVWNGTYDAYEYRIMVSLQGADEWTTTEIGIYYCPEWEFESAYINPATKDVALTVDTNTKRPPVAFALDWIDDPNYPAANIKPPISDYTLVPASGADDCKLQIMLPYRWASYIRNASGDIRGKWTGDVAGQFYKEPVAITLDPAFMADYIATPDNITFEETDTALQITVPHHAAGDGKVKYDGVTAAYSWTDARGAYFAGSVELVKSGTDWIGDIPTPPYGATVTIDVTATGSKTIDSNPYTVYATAPVTHKMGACNWFTLTYGDAMFFLGMNPSFSRQTNVDTETVTLASGRTVARHGKASTGQINLGGVIVSPATASTASVTSKWLPDVETLQEPHDWILRTPMGERYQVAVTSVNRDQNVGRYATVSVGLSEVD